MLTTLEELQARAYEIKFLVLDVDGVLTSGDLYYNPEGEALKVFNTLDGQGLKMAQRAGLSIAIITGRKSASLQKRLNDLGINLIRQGREDKWTALQELLIECPTPLNQIACMGDDWPDLSIMHRVGLALAPLNAHIEVAKRAHWQSAKKGGEGAVRDAVDLILSAQGHYQNQLDQYLTE